ncbi:hypothetical protein Cgig2_027812 [Carnegiea gigantea]|uniref:ENTH domain-containing protein n=1 Tax=Carnegiea gigantea TaxID=171969 RepID=A0A9Q1QAY3_9CARY|nr:hypothetical protein Cgig2_027812 [Carnegiea gigantea]
MAGGTNSSLRKYLGSIKDTTTINLAKVNSGFKELDIAIVKATNHVERPAKEKHVRALFAAISAARPRAEIAYCVHALAKRLSKTHNWAVALKTLIVIHRALREVDPMFREELINYGRSRNHVLNMSHFRDDSSASAWDYSAWVRAYALFLEERLECFCVLKYDVETERPRTRDLEVNGLLEQLPSLQQLLYRVLVCQPEGAMVHNHVIQIALSMVASESTKIYTAINDGTANLVDKFFEMERSDAVKALDIYQRSMKQAERLSEFYEVCKSLDMGRGERFIKIDQPPVSFLQAMEEYVSEASRGSISRKEQACRLNTVKQVVDEKPTVVLEIEDKEVADVKEARPPSVPPPEPVKEEKPVVEVPDLLVLDDPAPVASNLDEKNALALAIVPIGKALQHTHILVQTDFKSSQLENGTTGWELALVTAPTSTDTGIAATKLAGGLDKLTLDSLYDEAMRRANQPASYNPWETAPMNPPMMQQPTHNPFFTPDAGFPPPSMPMAAMVNQQQAFMLQPQAMMMAQQPPLPSMNPFANPYAANPNPYGPAMPVQAYNPYSGFA